MKKKIVKLTKSDLCNVIKESVNKILKEYDYEDGHPYGWPDDYLDDEDNQESNSLSIDDLGKIDKYCQAISAIANKCSDDCTELFKAIDIIDEFVRTKEQELIQL